jgi:hypothetical protein
MRKDAGKNWTWKSMKTNISHGSNSGGVGSANGLPQKAVDGWERPEPLTKISKPETLPGSLKPDQQLNLEECETKIARGWSTFIGVGEALTEIRDKELFKGKYKDFQEYCRIRWGYARTHAYRLIDAAKVIKDLSPIGEEVPKPANEAQVRELVQVPSEKRADVWTKSVKAAGKGLVTAKVVRSIANEFKPKRTIKPAEAKKPTKPSAKLKPVFKLLDDMEELAASNKRLLDKLTSLRVILLSFGVNERQLMEV